MTPTKDCPIYPPGFKGHKPALAMTHMPDEEIDEMLAEMQRKGELSDKEIPRTQYGRRVACETMFKLERYKGEQPVRKEFWRNDDLR